MEEKQGPEITYCDFDCPSAEYPEETGVDGSGSCRTFLAVWCRELGEYTAKNAPCRALKRRPAGD
jgi:hypothetical protein